MFYTHLGFFFKIKIHELRGTMANYNPASSVAEEFINEQEILDTVKYAQKE